MKIITLCLILLFSSTTLAKWEKYNSFNERYTNIGQIERVIFQHDFLFEELGRRILAAAYAGRSFDSIDELSIKVSQYKWTKSSKCPSGDPRLKQDVYSYNFKWRGRNDWGKAKESLPSGEPCR